MLQRSVVTVPCIRETGGPITCASGEAGKPFQATAFFNVADVTVKDVELEATALVTDNLVIKAKVS